MKQTKILMGMPITISVESNKAAGAIKELFAYFKEVDRRFSTYKKGSEISRINDGLPFEKWSSDAKEIFNLSDQTKKITGGYFNISHKGQIDPSGIVKGWAINNAAEILKRKGYKNFYIEAGGDIQTSGKSNNQKWSVGIRNPFNIDEIIKTVYLSGEAIATSGTYIRGQHIYSPKGSRDINKVASISIIGASIIDADRFATAAFAMGPKGINFIENMPGLEGYMIDNKLIGTHTSGFNRYVAKNN